MLSKEILALTFVVLLLLLGCKNESKKASLPHSLAKQVSPIQLGDSTSHINLKDYLIPGNRVDSVYSSMKAKLDFDFTNQRLSIVPGDELLALNTISFFTKTGRMDIPVFKSRKKKVEFIFDPGEKKYNQVELVGDMNAWNPALSNLKYENGLWKSHLNLLPGKYAYLLQLDGERIQDPGNDNKIGNGMGVFNSLLEVAEIDQNKQARVELLTHYNDEITFKTINAEEARVYLDNILLESNFHHDHFDISIPDWAKERKRSFIKIWAFNDESVSNYCLIPLSYGSVISNSKQLNRHDWQSSIMYFAMVDRFNNGEKENDWKIEDESIHPKANYFGGDLNGLKQKVEDGYFKKLGINSLWLSPVVQNPEGAFGFYNKGGIKSTFSAYHGYWPTSFTQVNPHFGNEESMKELVESAHEQDMNMVLDFVANHVHELHPVYQANKDNGWATNLYLPDGSLNTEKWDEQRLTTWFDVFLPTLNLERAEISEMLADSAIFWLENYEFDAFRHDATKHIPEIFWRTLTTKVKNYESKKGHEVLQLGETYGTPELINSYIGSGMLDGQFDFNVYDALSTSITQEDISFVRAAERIEQSLDYYGSNHLMGNITGNQDRARFMALATGDVRIDEDSKLAGWSREINSKTNKAYKRLAMLHAINLTIPGIPVIYYGDEIGMTGGNDPDNRRMMYFDSWNEEETQLFETVSQLSAFRKNKMSLLYGNMKFLEVEDDVMVYSRRYFEDMTIVLVNNREEAKQLIIQLPKYFTSDYLRSHQGNSFEMLEDGFIEISLPPLSFDILYN